MKVRVNDIILFNDLSKVPQIISELEGISLQKSKMLAEVISDFQSLIYT